MKVKHIVILGVISFLIFSLGATLKIIHYSDSKLLLIIGTLFLIISVLMIIIKVISRKCFKDFMNSKLMTNI